MGGIYKKKINSDFFKKWSSEMSYVLGYITADGCISKSTEKRKHPFSLNITSVDLDHLYLIRKTINSEHKISKKSKKDKDAYQLQIRNHIITADLINLGISPRKTYNLQPMKVPNKYFSDFVRGFFDGDGTVYLYNVNNTPQIKSSFTCASFNFIKDFNIKLCRALKIKEKSIHIEKPKMKEGINKYYIDFYIDDSEKLARFIYEKTLYLYLLRKKEVFRKWKNIKRRHYKKQNYPSKIGWHLNKNLKQKALRSS